MFVGSLAMTSAPLVAFRTISEEFRRGVISAFNRVGRPSEDFERRDAQCPGTRRNPARDRNGIKRRFCRFKDELACAARKTARDLCETQRGTRREDDTAQNER
jgi:hypothetical protein